MRDASGIDSSASACAVPSLVRICPLRRRAEFLACAKGARAGAARVGIQGLRRAAGPTSGPEPIRVGFTASKKVGNAVLRNRAKRRLREIARALLPEYGVAGCDYVLVARPATPESDWPALLDEARRGLIKLRPILSRVPSRPPPASASQAGSGEAGSGEAGSGEAGSGEAGSGKAG